MNAFLITFKPDTESPERGWPIKSLQKLVSRLEQGRSVREPWRFLNRRDVSVGDRVFLLLQGKRGPAIIGLGSVAPRGGRNWKNLDFEVLVDPEITTLASKDQLLAIPGLGKWLRTQASGIRLPDTLAAAVENLVLNKGDSPESSVARQLKPKQRILEQPKADFCCASILLGNEIADSLKTPGDN